MQQPIQPNDPRPGIFDRPWSNTPYGILLMDDEEGILDSFGKLLKMKGFVVYAACNGEQAVDLYKQSLYSKRKVDVAVIDLTIPDGMGGLETIARLKEIDPDVRAIATTGHLEDDQAFEYKKYGFFMVLPKPYVLEELLDAIDGVIRMERIYP
ncbi:MAG: response regulator [Methanomicrobiales archaeon]|nr:response regulator [Methanomicrobiales archaeon]